MVSIMFIIYQVLGRLGGYRDVRYKFEDKHDIVRSKASSFVVFRDKREESMGGKIVFVFPHSLFSYDEVVHDDVALLSDLKDRAKKIIFDNLGESIASLEIDHEDIDVIVLPSIGWYRMRGSEDLIRFDSDILTL